jgi:peptidoglycan hydrolase-like protein with peptidoglycan-binding domain
MKKLLAGGLFVLLCMPFVTHAITAQELQAQIQALLAQIAALQTQASYQPTVPTYTQPTTYQPTGYTSATVPSSATFQYSRCPDLQYNLERGDTDAEKAVEITMLQRFLAQDSQLYPEAQITGFFGPATERAVQRFQERHGVVSYGDYQATGYGRVGPRTRWAIKNSCGVDGGINTPTPPFEVAPTSGVAPLAVTIGFNGTGPYCTSYYIDWGDGTQPALYDAPSPTVCTEGTFERRVTHTYVQSGTFILTFRMGHTTAAQAPVVGSTPITVIGNVAPPVVQNPTVDDFATCFVSPLTGSAPLSSRARVVLGGSLCDGQFTYQVDWGDGSLSESRACSSTAGHYDTFQHTYSTAGTYTARLLQAHPQARFADESCTVTVSTANTGVYGSTSQTAPPTCLQWYDGCNTCSRSYAYGAAVCTQRYCAQYGALQCYQYASNTTTGTVQNDGLSVASRSAGSTAETITFNTLINGSRNCDGGVYTMDFGDGQYDQQPYPADACRAFERQVSHTYTSNGVYTVRLIKNGVTQSQLQIQVSSVVSAVSQYLASAWSGLMSVITSVIR